MGATGFPGSNVITQQSSLQTSSSVHSSVSGAQYETESHLSKVDQSLYSVWEGAAGDAFRYASYTIETRLNTLAHRNDNASNALDYCKLKFDELDSALENNLVVDYGNSSSEGDG